MAEKTNTIKNKIVVEGEKEYKASLGQARQANAELRSEMRATKAEFAGQEESVESLQAQIDILNRQYDVNKRQCETLEEYLQKTAQTFGENSKEASNLRISLNNARAAMNTTGNELSTLRTRLEAMGDAGGGMDEVAESARRAQGDVQDLIDEIGNTAVSKVIGFVVGSDAFNAIAEGLKEAVTWAIGEGVDGAKEHGYLQAGSGDAALTQARLDVKDAIDRRWSGRLDGMQTAAAIETVDTTMDNASLTTPGLVEQVANAAIFQQERFGQDIGGQMGRADAMVKTFGVDWMTAFDLMTLGFQNSHDGGEMMLKMFDENSQVFKQMGYDADDMFTVILDAVNNSELGKDSNLNKGMLALINTVTGGGKEAKETLEALGMEASDIGFKAQQGGETAAAAYHLILEKLMMIEDVDLRNQLGKSLFGDNVWTSTGGDIAEALLFGFGQTIEADGTTQAAMDALLDNISDNWAGTMERAGQQIGSATEPLVNEVNDFLKEVNQKTDAMGGDVLKGFSQVSADHIAELVTEEFGAAKEIAKSSADELHEAIDDALKVLNDNIAEADGSLLAGLGDTFAQASRQMGRMAAEAFDSLNRAAAGGENDAGPMDAFLQANERVAREAAEAFDSLTLSVREKWDEVFTGQSEGAAQAAAAATEDLYAQLDALEDQINAAWADGDTFKALTLEAQKQQLIDEIAKTKQEVISGFDAMGEEAATAFEGRAGDFDAAANVTSQAAIDAMNGKQPDMQSAGEDLGGAASDGLEAALSDGEDAGSNYGDAVASGIRSKTTAVRLAAMALGAAAPSGTKVSMRIASPSKAGLEMGENYGGAVATGIGNRERDVAAAGEVLGRAADAGMRQSGGYAAEPLPASIGRQLAGMDEEAAVRAFRRAMNGMAVQFDGMTAGRLLEEGVSVAEYDRAAATVSGRSASRRI
ncbi:MAG: hypothetical protein IKJ11_11000 [Clostridia bacterium]|nr:hypothetical protein [Clostridia bacterium]